MLRRVAAVSPGRAAASEGRSRARLLATALAVRADAKARAGRGWAFGRRRHVSDGAGGCCDGGADVVVWSDRPSWDLDWGDGHGGRRRGRTGCDAAVSDVAAVLLGSDVGDVRARVGEEGVDAFDGRAAVADVGAEDVGALGEGDGGCGSASRSDGDAGTASRNQQWPSKTWYRLGREGLGPEKNTAGGAGDELHVHLAIAGVVEPDPSQQGVRAWSIGGDDEAEVRGGLHRALFPHGQRHVTTVLLPTA